MTKYYNRFFSPLFSLDGLSRSLSSPSSRKICSWPAKPKEPQSSWPTLVWPLKFRANSKPGSVSFSSGLLHLKSISFLSYFFDIFALCVKITRYGPWQQQPEIVNLFKALNPNGAELSVIQHCLWITYEKGKIETVRPLISVGKKPMQHAMNNIKKKTIRYGYIWCLWSCSWNCWKNLNQ